jgi:hypothetical protein
MSDNIKFQENLIRRLDSSLDDIIKSKKNEDSTKFQERGDLNRRLDSKKKKLVVTWERRVFYMEL